MSQKGFANIIGILILALFFGGLGFAFYKGYLVLNTPKPETSNPTPSASPTPQPSSTPTSDETANWKTYTNTKYQFTFKYPANASIVGDAENINYDKAEGQIVSIDGPGLDLNVSYDLTVAKESIIKGTEMITLNNQQWNVLIEDPKGNCPPGLGPCTSMLEYQTVINNKLVTFIFRRITDKVIPNKILSTFKFTQ